MATKRYPRDHTVLNVYGKESTEIVEEAIERAMDDGAETRYEAVERLARAYNGLL